MNKKLIILSICLLSASLNGCVVKSAFNNSNAGETYGVNRSDKIILTDNFADVCNGSKIDKAAAYEKTAGTISPILIFYQEGAGRTYQNISYHFPQDWATDYPEIAKNQLVACIAVTERKAKRECNFEENKKKYRLRMNDAKYNVRVFEAKTGALVAEKDFDLKAEKECPMLHFFFGPEENQDPDYEQPVIDFLKPLLRP
jgi:hypothetical protein